MPLTVQIWKAMLSHALITHHFYSDHWLNSFQALFLSMIVTFESNPARYQGHRRAGAAEDICERVMTAVPG